MQLNNYLTILFLSLLLMEIKVRLDSEGVGRHNFLLQITENSTTWYISKRYKQISLN